MKFFKNRGLVWLYGVDEETRISWSVLEAPDNTFENAPQEKTNRIKHDDNDNVEPLFISITGSFIAL